MDHKSIAPIFANYDLELQALWRKHIKSTKSDVLCEKCNLQVEWWKNPDVKIRPYLAKVYHDKKFCECPDSEPGKIKIDPERHLPGCKYHKVKTKTTDLTIPVGIQDGYSLGVPMT